MSLRCIFYSGLFEIVLLIMIIRHDSDLGVSCNLLLPISIAWCENDIALDVTNFLRRSRFLKLERSRSDGMTRSYVGLYRTSSESDRQQSLLAWALE